ncbi:MAG: efflux transporter outer membrane subunit [Luteolibacter sp.]
MIAFSAILLKLAAVMGLRRLLELCLLGFTLNACAYWRIGRPLDAVQVHAPDGWMAASTGANASISNGWLAGFNDPVMTRLVDEALVHNQDLMAVAAAMREAGQSTLLTRARQRPTLDLGGGGTLVDSPDFTSSSRQYGLNLAASWELDVWGRLRELTAAAQANEQAAVEDYRGARLSLAANTAKAWCNLLSAGQELALAKVTLDSFEKNLRIIERNYRGTGEGALDIQFGRTNVSSARRAVESRKVERDEAARSLELLLGRYPGGMMRDDAELPKLPDKIPAGLPAELLDRRPDLAAARARLFASARLADASRKSLLPSFSITAAGNAASPRLSDLLDWQKLTGSVAGTFAQTISSGGALSAEARASLIRNERLLHGYAQAALNAFREVEAALAADRSLAKQESFLSDEMAQAVLAERQAERDYAEGINPNILSVLEAQRRANNARAGMIRLRNERLQNRIDLHLALGGDFHTIKK